MTLRLSGRAGRGTWAQAHVLDFLATARTSRKAPVWCRTEAPQDDGEERGVPVSSDELARALAPICREAGVELYDVELAARVLRVTIEAPGALSLETTSAVARRISILLDASEDLAPAGPYELEVTSPGLERRLRRPEHFAAARGAQVAIRTVAGVAGERRIEGALAASDDAGIVVRTATGERRLGYGDVDRAHTVFDWRGALAGSQENKEDDVDKGFAAEGKATRR